MVSRFDEDPFQHSRNRDVQLLNRMDQHDVYGTSSSFNNSILLTGGSSSNNNNDILAVLEEGTSTSNTTVRTNSSITATTKPAKRKRESTLRKAPGAPKRFKSSYILFFMAHRDEIKNELGAHASVGDVSKRSSERWKKLTKEEKMIWEEKARADKERYNIEKEKYTGPWQVPFKRAKKNPDAPKRPMSAFLYYSQEKRSHVKENNPGMKNTEVSRILGKMWQDATDEERAPHIEREKVEREKYKASMASWRKKEEGRKAETEKLRKETSMTPQTTYNYDIPEPIPFSAASSPTHPINQQDYPFGQHEHFYQGYNYHPPPDYMPSYTNEQYSYRRASVPYSNDRPSSYYHTSERHNVKAHRDYGQQPIRVYQDYGRTHARSHNDYANEDLRTWPYEYNPESHPSTNRTNDNVIYGSSYYAAASDNYENPNISSTQSSSHLF